MFMNGAALGRHIGPERRKRPLEAGRAVGDQELRRAQAASDQVVQHRSPCRLALAGHVLDRQQDLLPVHPERRARPAATGWSPRGRAGPARPCRPGSAARCRCRPDRACSRPPNPCAPCPGPAHHVLADRAAKQRAQRALDPPGIGAGQVSTDDQSLDLPRHPGIAGQYILGCRRPAPPSGRAARSSRSGRSCRKAAVRACRDGSPSACPAPFVTASPQRRRQLLLQQLVDKPADPIPDARLGRVKQASPANRVSAVSLVVLLCFMAWSPPACQPRTGSLQRTGDDSTRRFHHLRGGTLGSPWGDSPSFFPPSSII